MPVSVAVVPSIETWTLLASSCALRLIALRMRSSASSADRRAVNVIMLLTVCTPVRCYTARFAARRW